MKRPKHVKKDSLGELNNPYDEQKQEKRLLIPKLNRISLFYFIIELKNCPQKTGQQRNLAKNQFVKFVQG